MVAKLDDDLYRMKVSLNECGMYLSREETTEHLKAMEEKMKAKKIDLQASVMVGKLAESKIATILEHYRVRLWDELFFEHGIEEEDIQAAKLGMRSVIGRIDKDGNVIDKDKKKKVKKDKPKVKHIWGEEFMVGGAREMRTEDKIKLKM